MEWDGGRGDKGCPNRSCGTCLPACARINLLTPGSWRAGEGPWGPGRILRDLLAQLHGDRSCKREAAVAVRAESLCVWMRKERRLAVAE